MNFLSFLVNLAMSSILEHTVLKQIRCLTMNRILILLIRLSNFMQVERVSHSILFTH